MAHLRNNRILFREEEERKQGLGQQKLLGPRTDLFTPDAMGSLWKVLSGE